MTYMLFRSGLGMSSAVLRLTAKGEYTLYVGVTDVGAGAKTTMGLIAAEALNVPLTQVNVVWGDTDRCPYSVGESGSRTTIMTGTAPGGALRVHSCVIVTLDGDGRVTRVEEYLDPAQTAVLRG